MTSTILALGLFCKMELEDLRFQYQVVALLYEGNLFLKIQSMKAVLNLLLHALILKLLILGFDDSSF